MSRKKRNSMNFFDGSNHPVLIETISVKDMSPKSFFDNFVSKRVPVKLIGHITDKEWKGEFWTNEYLINRSGEDVVRVERKSVDNRYGRGVEEKMKFVKFLRSMESGDNTLYLTTQELSHDEDGRPAITSPPVDSISSDFPKNPIICGHLIPSNINLWMGSTSKMEWTSSGLHHDYHDNLYIVLRGEKRLFLISPKEAENMYTFGSISYVHFNGRINYVGQSTKADGVDIKAEKALNASKSLEAASKKLDELKGKASISSIRAKEEEDEAEEEIDRALESLLDAEIDNESEDESEGEGEDDDSQADDRDDFPAGFLDNQVEDEEGGDGLSKKTNNSVAVKGETTAKPVTVASTTSKEPLNFSQVDTSLPEEEIRRRFPLYADSVLDKRGGFHVEVSEGEMLFLPAGWFHEVHSHGVAPRGHMAFNYWFHPPDNNVFEKPYISDFWLNDWIDRGFSRPSQS